MVQLAIKRSAKWGETNLLGEPLQNGGAVPMLKQEPGWDSVCIEFGDLSPIPIRGGGSIISRDNRFASPDPNIWQLCSRGNVSKGFQNPGFADTIGENDISLKTFPNGTEGKGETGKNWDCGPQRNWNSKRSVKRGGWGIGQHHEKHMCSAEMHDILFTQIKNCFGVELGGFERLSGFKMDQKYILLFDKISYTRL